MRFNGTTVPNYRDETYDTSEVSRYKSSSGGDIEVESLNVTENGIYTAPDGKAYSPVNVNVAGGGGSSDFHKATIMLEVSTPTFDQVYMPDLHTIDGEVGGFIVSDGTIIIDEPEAIEVKNPNAVILEVEILNDKYITISTGTASEVFTISGDAELSSMEGYNFVKVFGDCTISTEGDWK